MKSSPRGTGQLSQNYEEEVTPLRIQLFFFFLAHSKQLE